MRRRSGLAGGHFPRSGWVERLIITLLWVKVPLSHTHTIPCCLTCCSQTGTQRVSKRKSFWEPMMFTGAVGTTMPCREHREGPLSGREIHRIRGSHKPPCHDRCGLRSRTRSVDHDPVVHAAARDVTCVDNRHVLVDAGDVVLDGLPGSEIRGGIDPVSAVD